MTLKRTLLALTFSLPLLAQQAALPDNPDAGQQTLIDATYLAQVANYLAGNLASLDVVAQSYTVDGFGMVIDSNGTWLGAPLPAETPAQLLGKISTVDGVGSGLDADLLDGRDSGQFVDLNSDQNISGWKVFEQGIATLDIRSDRNIEVGSTTRGARVIITSDSAAITINRLDGSRAGELGLNPEDEFTITTTASKLRIGDDLVLRYSDTTSYKDLFAGNIDIDGHLDFASDGVSFGQLLGDSNGIRVFNANLRVGENLRVDGDMLVYGVKNFIQPHPMDPSKEIYYVSLEGGEAGTYCRGTGQLIEGKALVRLPEHFALVTEAEGLTAQVTPLEDCAGLYVLRVSPQELEVRELAGGHSRATFAFTVNGIREGYHDFQVIRPIEVAP